MLGAWSPELGSQFRRLDGVGGCTAGEAEVRSKTKSLSAHGMSP